MRVITSGRMMISGGSALNEEDAIGRLDSLPSRIEKASPEIKSTGLELLDALPRRGRLEGSYDVLERPRI